MHSAGPAQGGAERGAGRHRRATFSLLQLFIGLGLLAVVSAVAIPAWFARPDITLDNATILLAEDLREAQNRAAFGHRFIDVVFLPDGDGYEVRGDDARPIEARVGSGPFRREYSRDAVFRGVRLQVVSGAPEGKLSYDRLGFLAQPAKLTLAYRGERSTIDLEERTGKITVEGTREPWIDDGE